MPVTIYQGSSPPAAPAAVTIVIDVLRAFTTAHYALKHGAKEIVLVPTKEAAFQLREQHPDCLLAGEINGLQIPGFDFGNSPLSMDAATVANKTIVLKTTNGVRAALNCLASEHLYVTGFSNARQTADFVRNQHQLKDTIDLQIIASHPTGDDDLACAEYIESIVTEARNLTAEMVSERIKHCQAAEKFWDENQPDFDSEDAVVCMKETESDFVMKVNRNTTIPTIERVSI